MKVLHVIPSVSPRDGGPSRAIVDIERALCARGIDVTTVTTLEPKGEGPEADCGKPIRTGGATRWYFRRNSSFYKISLPMASWLRHNIGSFDVIHAHALFSFAPVTAAFLARRAGVPYVLRPLGVLNRYGMTEHHAAFKRLSFAAIERPLIERANAVHFTSRAEKAEAERLNVRCRGVVVPLGIDQGDASSAAGTAVQPDTDRLSLLFLSRIDPKKNLEGLLRAFSRVHTRYPTLDLNIAGDGDDDYVRGLKSLAGELAIAERVRWHGYVEGREKQQIIAAATAFVLPSYSENFGIAAVEALAAGLPCIVSREVAVSEEIERACAGLVVGTDPDSIAGGIDTLMAERDGHAALRAAARKLASDVFSLSAMGQKLERLYDDVTCGHAQQEAVLC